MFEIETFFHRKQHPGRHFAHVTFWLIIILSIGLFFKWIDLSHDDELFLSLMGIASAGIMLLPWILIRYIKAFQKINLAKLTQIELYLALMMILSWAGSLGLYRAGIEYDTFAHFANSALTALIVISLLIATAPKLSKKPWLIILLAFVAVMLSGIITELFEWSGDKLIGTGMFGEIGEPTDTQKDMIVNTIGFAAGTYLSLTGRLGRKS